MHRPRLHRVWIRVCVRSALVALGWPTFVGAAVATSGSATSVSASAGTVDFLSEVRPILASQCFKCHGPDEKTRKGGLRLDLGEAARQPAKSGARAVVPGHVENSELVRRIRSADEDEVMPPPSTKRTLTDAQKATLERWIAQGAEYRPHWAFVLPKRPAVPEVTVPAGSAAMIRNPIDAFIQARLGREGLTPSPEADRLTLIRRLSLDLVGLPPTPEEADAFANDSSPQAYEALVDRLLTSRHYGERWARRWMDLARYSDTNGYEKDRQRSMWPWRDWLIRALNDDLPFDQFTVQQIAGDLLPQASIDQRVATGFHRNTMINEEGGIDPLEFRFYAMVDRVHTTATTWLGLTMACVQCHTHKYDPIQHHEYYQFMAFLDNADEPVMDVTTDPLLVARRREAETLAATLENSLLDRFPPEEKGTWVTPTLAFATESGSAADRLADGSYRLRGQTPEADVYTLTFDTTATNVVAFNLDALADDALPNQGPGRVAHGNFVLSEVIVRARPLGRDVAFEKVALGEASADFEQNGFPARNAIDGRDDTGWAIAGEGHWNINRRATFRLAKAVGFPGGAQFEVRLVQRHGGQHVLGRLRWSYGIDDAEGRPLEKRRREHLAKRFASWAEREATHGRSWTTLTPLAATSSVPVLTIQEDGSIFASSDMTKSDTYDVRVRNPLPRITALRLEVLADDRLPRRGPGRVYYEGPFGDFFVSTFSVKAGEQSVKLVRATESFASGGNTAAKAIDEDQQSGWAIDGGQGRDHVAVFNLEKPLEGATELQIALLCEKYYAAGLGRFRISATSDPRGAEATAVPDDLQVLLARPANERSEAEAARLLKYYARVAPELAAARAEIQQIRREAPAYPTTLVMQERPKDNPRATWVRHRGEFLQPTERVQAALPAMFAALTQEAPKNRLEFARWLVSRENPLTARVAMNRQWAALFGRGLVRTTEDFGFQGELPTHPELLDWLAVEFMDRGWSQKQMQKLMVLSATYRQSARVTPEAWEKDPQNRWLARGPRFRVEGELVRDLALAVSGLLSPKVGGPSVFPPQLPGITKEGTYGALEWKVSVGEDRYRRGLYTFAKRTAPYATFSLFDAPSGEACVARREVSNTPLQSLALLNDEVFVEAARALGRQAAALPGGVADRATWILRRCLTRQPAAAELSRILAFYQAQRERLATGGLQPEDLGGSGGGDAVERAAWTAVARAVLNLDETVTRG